jgi:hypothetical protein
VNPAKEQASAANQVEKPHSIKGATE